MVSAKVYPCMLSMKVGGKRNIYGSLFPIAGPAYEKDVMKGSL